MDIEPLVEELKRVKREKERRLDLVVDFSRVRAVLKRGEAEDTIPLFGEHSFHLRLHFLREGHPVCAEDF
ncbi:MAG: hypothetical protein OCU22_05695 [Canidatus Methanoxibalbensis ujae]|nr:hypothetical protein [Candidatus Methanoxibalbensis ujae]